MLVQTSRFGEIEVKDDQIISFPSGLIGFSEGHRFVIREDEAAAPFRWLQSIDSEDLAFVMIEPHVSISNYELELTNDHLKKLHQKLVHPKTLFLLRQYNQSRDYHIMQTQ